MPLDLVIVGVGMTTAVGLNRLQTASSVRAGIARLRELPLRNRVKEPFVVGCLPDDALPELKPEVADKPGLTTREARLLRLAQPALLEALAALPGKTGPLPLLLGLSELDTGLPLQMDRLLDCLPVQSGAPIDPARSKVIRKGRAAGLFALQEAATLLQAGTVPVVVAGAVDSFKDLYLLGTLDLDGRINSSETLDGFIPGEGAAFLVVTTAATAQKQQLPALAIVRGLKTGFEEGHLGSKEPYKGEGLARVFQELFADVGSTPPVRDVYSSMNGESHWGKEWGVGYLRSASQFDGKLRLTHPADCYGDPGAAAGTLLTGLATVNLQKGLARPPVLVYSSSDLGDRAALLLDQATSGRK